MSGGFLVTSLTECTRRHGESSPKSGLALSSGTISPDKTASQTFVLFEKQPVLSGEILPLESHRLGPVPGPSPGPTPAL